MKTWAGRWWDRSWSVVSGCSWPPGETPSGCASCWATGFVRRFPGSRGPHAGCLPSEVRTHPERLDIPLRTRKPTTWGVPINLGDLFHSEVPNEFIAAAIGVMAACPQHTFAVVTKRWRRAAEWFAWAASLPFASGKSWRDGAPVTGYLGEYAHHATDGKCNIWMPGQLPPWPLPNAYVMASAWDQASANDAARHLAPLGIRWGLHIEPCLDRVDLSAEGDICHCGETVADHGYQAGHQAVPMMEPVYPSCRWIVCGAENGPGARPMDPDWARLLRDQCARAGVPFWLKSLGRGKGRMLDGLESNEVPW